MKRTLLLLPALFFALSLHAQFILSGKIQGHDPSSGLKINIPLVYGYNRVNDTVIPVDKDGSFRISLPVKAVKFADLIYNKKFFTLLLTPGKNLAVKLNRKDTTLSISSGSAAKENALLTRLAIGDEGVPQKIIEDNKSHLTSLADIQHYVIDQLYALRDRKIREVQVADLSPSVKKLISAELKYDSYVWADAVRMLITDGQLAKEYYLYLYDPLSPDPDVMPAGPAYYKFARNFLGYLGPKTMANKQAKNIKDNEPLDFYKISADSANFLANKYGNPYLRWIVANNMLQPGVAEALTYQEIVNLFTSKDLPQLEPLADVFVQRFKQSAYVASTTALVTRLKASLENNKNNQNIRVYPGYASARSIYEVVNTLKGKVIYLDIWGTWCGPCKAEIPFLPQLKKRFTGKDVVFMYLDMDEEAKDADWKNFIVVNGMEGIHLRKNRQDIAAFWDELGIKPDDRYYPRYFIFDKAGKLVHQDAARPSSEETLYTQIDQYLN